MNITLAQDIDARTSFDVWAALSMGYQGIQRIVGFLENADDVTLDFLGLTDERRDFLCEKEYIIAESPKSFLSITPHADKPFTIECGDAFGRMNEVNANKILCHEIGHHKDAGALKAVNIGRAGLRGSAILPTIGVGMGYYYHHGWLGLGIGVATAHAVKALCYLPLRSEERKADDFSDRMMPEVTFRTAIRDLLDLPEERDVLEILNPPNDFAYQRFFHLFKSHPSDYIRNKRSDKNCPLYLAEKKRLGIPSLICGA